MNNNNNDTNKAIINNINKNENIIDMVGASDVIDDSQDNSIVKDDRINYYDIKQDDDDKNTKNSSEILLLPPPIDKDPSEMTMKLGEKLSMDYLGPIIVNADGTLRRIENWDKLTKLEQDKSFRLIAARNKKRIEILKQKEQEEQMVMMDS